MVTDVPQLLGLAGQNRGSIVAGEKILVIEDDQDIADLLQYNLERERYHVVLAATGEKGLEAARQKSPSLILLDLMLPGINGLDVCRTLKDDATTRSIPIIMISARTEEADIVSGLELGADDYITKPFSPREVLARLRAVLRRRQPEEEPSSVSIHDIVIDSGKYEVTVAKQKINLTPTEFKLLLTLASRPGWVFTRYQLVNAIRGEDVMVTDRTVDVHVAGVRKKLGASGKYLNTIRGVGYRFEE